MRRLTLAFVEEIFLLESAISRISAERFDGRPLLFSDCTAQLKQQVDVADGVVACFNALARARNFGEITAEAIRKNIQAEAEQQVLRWVSIAQLEMLAAFGEPRAFRAVLDQVVAPKPKPAGG